MSQDALHTALAAITDPQTGRPLVESGRIAGVDVREGAATVVLKAAPGGAGDDALKAAVKAAGAGIEGLSRIRVIFEASGAGKPARDVRGEGPSLRPGRAEPAAPVKPPAKRVIAVGSGKGGVGKSTVAANLAAACVKLGLKTGFMDADVYGPSAPRLFGLTEAPGLRRAEGGGIEPLEAHGIKLVSIGFLVGAREAVIWRGPMVTGAIRQFLTEAAWGDLDVLIIDMPPGTGDAQLALAQGAPIDGAVLVSTPQDLALDDVRKAAALFDKASIPVLGVVENMSVFLCPHCGEPSEIFGRGGARAEADALGAPFLGEVPLTMEIRAASDAGRLVAMGEGPVPRAFLQAAHAMLEAAETANRPAPEIVFVD